MVFEISDCVGCGTTDTMTVELSPTVVTSKLLLKAVNAIDFNPPSMFKCRGEYADNHQIILSPLTPTLIAIVARWKWFFLDDATRKFTVIVRYVASGSDAAFFDIETREGRLSSVFNTFVHVLPYPISLGQSLRTAFQTTMKLHPSNRACCFDALRCFMTKSNLDVLQRSVLSDIADNVVHSVADSFVRYRYPGITSENALNALIIGEKADLLEMVAKFNKYNFNTLVLNFYGQMGNLATVSKAVVAESSSMKFIGDKLKKEGIRPLSNNLNLDDASYYTEHCSLFADALITEFPIQMPRVLFATPCSAALFIPKLKALIHQIVVLDGNAISDIELLAILSSQEHCRRLSVYINSTKDSDEFSLFKNSYIQPCSAASWFYKSH